MTTPDSKRGIEAMLPPQTRWENRVAARILLRIGAYRPGRQAANISCPVLVCICERDALAPAERTAELVLRAPLAEIERYPYGHFDIYVGDPFERVVADEVAFLQRHLVTPRPAVKEAASERRLRLVPPRQHSHRGNAVTVRSR